MSKLFEFQDSFNVYKHLKFIYLNIIIIRTVCYFLNFTCRFSGGIVLKIISQSGEDTPKALS
jgi:hypothetical protein